MVVVSIPGPLVNEVDAEEVKNQAADNVIGECPALVLVIRYI